jgi:hypothetical protein
MIEGKSFIAFTEGVDFIIISRAKLSNISKCILKPQHGSCAREY